MCRQLTFAHLPYFGKWGHTGLQCLFGCLGMLFMATIRAFGETGAGMLATVAFSVAMISGQFEPSTGDVWAHVSHISADIL